MNSDEVIVGIGGARRNAALAVVRGGHVEMACELERFTRSRAEGFTEEGAARAMRHMLALCRLDEKQVRTLASAEEGLAIDGIGRHSRFPHHYAHASASFLASPYESAAILVCDSGSAPGVTLWRGTGAGVASVDWRWRGPSLVDVYRAATAALGFAGGRDEHRLEALARVGDEQTPRDPRLRVGFLGDCLDVPKDFVQIVANLMEQARRAGLAFHASLAQSIQGQLGDVLVGLLEEARQLVDDNNVCLAGGLFYNTYFNSVAAGRGPFRNCFVPPNPGNPGLAIGASLAASPGSRQRTTEAAYLGPSYDDANIKQQLDNCKLTYEYQADAGLMQTASHALDRGMLVGWFQGRMEWGPRALGHRSILANPLKPFALANLNSFLKQGSDYRTYGIMVLEEEAERYLCHPRPSRFMEFESELADPERFRALLPYRASRVRYQTVGPDQPRLRELLRAVGQKTGCSMLINTSFNGFQEPIACTPRDAVRVFYGTGIDMLVVGNFVLRK